MSVYLAYSYSVCLPQEEQAEIDQQVKVSRKEFCRGFKKGIKISISVYSIYAIVRATSAQAADSCPDSGNVVLTDPKDTGVVPAHQTKPGHKPLGEGLRGAFVGGASAICGATLQSGDFSLGIACAFLLVIGGIVINRPHPQNSAQ